MLKIAQITDTFIPVVDGVGRVAYAYADTLARQGHEVTVITPMQDTGNRGKYPFEIADFKGITLPINGIRQYKVGEAEYDPHYRKRIEMIPLDIVHAHSPFTAGTEGLRLAAKRDIPLVGSFHSKYYDDFLKITGSESAARMGTKFIVNFYNRCDEVWAVGERTAQVLREYGYTGELAVMPNGVDIVPPRDEDIKAVRQRFPIKENIPLLLFVGQMNWKKNILRVLEGCAILKSKGIDHTLLLAGLGPDEAQICGKIKELGLENNAHPIGHITDMSLLAALYTLSDLFLFPSLYDNAPMVVREAAAMGTPSVMIEGSSGAEVIDDNVNGFLCRDDSAAFAERIQFLLENPDMIKTAGVNARDTIPVPWDRIMSTAVERYSILVEKNKKGLLQRKVRRLL